MLREAWEGSSKASDESVVSYVISTQKKLKEMTDIVQENLGKVQTKQKTWYDKKARMREFSVGDPVLMLLPTASSKLLAQCQDPYQVVKCLGKVSYLIDMHDKRKRRVSHVNMLKEFRVRQPVETVAAENSDGDEDVLLWDDSPEGQPTIGKQLNATRKEQLGELLDNFDDILQNKPGRT